MADGIINAVNELNLNYTLNRVGSMLTLFFTDRQIVDFDTAKTSDTEKFARFFNQVLESGIYLPPSQFEAWFVSIAHTQNDLDETIKASKLAFEKLVG